MSKQDLGKSKIVSGVLAALAVLLTVGTAFVVVPKIQWGPPNGDGPAIILSLIHI